MRRRAFIQTVAAVLGAAAIAPRVEPEATGETLTVQYPKISQIDRDFARLAHENIQRRTYAVMRGFT